MPELPEVETTRRGIEPHAVGRRIVALAVHEPRLRWRIPDDLPARVAGQRILHAKRRAKYLLLELESGTLLLHLGMSGSLRVLSADTPRMTHDHFDLVLDSGSTLRFNDPRRFGSLHYTTEDPASHRLLSRLAPEPLGQEFDGEYLFKITRRRRSSIKQVLMNSRLVVGVGNIYADESLWRAKIHPAKTAAGVPKAQLAALRRGLQDILKKAIVLRGSTIADFQDGDGEPGEYQKHHRAYGREGHKCQRCASIIRRTIVAGRSSYYCPKCQPSPFLSGSALAGDSRR